MLRYVSRSAAAVAMFFLSDAAIAEGEMTPLPVVEKFASGFPADQSTDILGISLGMSYAEVSSIVTEKFPATRAGSAETWHEHTVQSYQVGMTAPGSLGPTFDPAVSTLIAAERFDDKLPEGRMAFVFGSGATAGRLEAMARYAAFTPATPRNDLIEALMEKYGVQISSAHTDGYTIELRAAYLSGSLLAKGKYLADNCEASKVRGGTFRQTHAFQIYSIPFLYYSFGRDRLAPAKMSGGCDAIIQIRLTPQPGRPDLIDHMSIHVIDHVATTQDMTAVDHAIKAAYDLLPRPPAREKIVPEL